MGNLFKNSVWLFLLASALVGGEARGDSTASQISIDMASELTRVGVNPAAATVKGVIVTDSSASWIKGSPQDVNPAFYSLQVTSGTVASVNHGLKIDYNPIRIPAVEVSACNGDSINCAVLSVQSPGGGQASFSLDGNSYLLTSLGPPCVTGVTCSFYLSSWHLMNMVRELNGAPPVGFPRIAAIVDSPGAVYIMDLERKYIWLTVAKGGLPTSGNIGDLIDTHYDGAGVLTLNFADNRVLLDFVRDRLLLATSDELLVADSALVGMGASGFSPVLAVPRVGESTSRLLHLSVGVAVWSTHYLTAGSLFQVGQISLRECPQALSAAEAHSGGLIGLSVTNSHGQKWQLVNGLLQAQGMAFPIDSSAASYRIIRGDIWKTSTNSATLIDVSNGAATPTSIANADVRSILPGHAALRRQVGTNCRYAHLVQHAGSAAAFKDSGLVMSCNSYAGITSSGEAMAMYGQSGTVVQAAYISK